MTDERKTVTAEGADIESAVKVAAEALAVSEAAVDYQVDKDWFRNEHGSMVPRSTVQIIAWERDGSLVEACDAAAAWLTQLLEKMDIAAEVRAALNGMTVTLHVKAEKPGLVVGKGGKTIEGIRHLLDESVGADHPEMSFRIKVADDRPRERDGGRDRDRGELRWRRRLPRRPHLRVRYIPSKENPSDYFSREADKADWSFDPQVVQPLLTRRSPVTVDRFADKHNRVVERFKSWD